MASPQAIQQWAGPRRLDRYRSLYPGQDGSAAPMVLRVAWAGRTSTYDQQDPTLSLPPELTIAPLATPPLTTSCWPPLPIVVPTSRPPTLSVPPLDTVVALPVPPDTVFSVTPLATAKPLTL